LAGKCSAKMLAASGSSVTQEERYQRVVLSLKSFEKYITLGVKLPLDYME